MIKKVLLVSVVFLGLLGSVSAQTRSLTVDEMFQLPISTTRAFGCMIWPYLKQNRQ